MRSSRSASERTCSPGSRSSSTALVEHADARARVDAAGVRSGSVIRQRRVRRPARRRAMIELGPDDALTYSPEWRKARERETAGNALLGTTGDPEPELLADLDGDRVGACGPARDRRDPPATAPRPERQLVRGRRAERGLGAARSWASPTSSGCGSSLRSASGSTSPIPWPRGASTSTDSTRAPLRSPSSGPTRSGIAARERTSPSGSCRARTGAAPVSAPPGGSTTSRTCRPRRSSPLPTRAAPRGLCARACRSASPGSSSGPRAHFEEGRIVRVEAETGAEIVRTHLATIDNADRLGELALVTKESRVGQTETLFYNTLFDENATCHIAYGVGLPYAFDGEPDER